MKRPTSASLDRAAAMISIDTMQIEGVMKPTTAEAFALELYLLADALDVQASKCELPAPTKIPGQEAPNGDQADT